MNDTTPTPPSDDTPPLPKEVTADGDLCDEIRALEAVMRILREPGGCPWDRAQTHESLRPYLVEEAYEVLEAIDEGRYDELRDELGDLLLQIVFHARIAEEQERFRLADSVRAIRRKLLRRHPHVFGGKRFESAEQVRDEWERIKLRDQDKPEGAKSTLGGVPSALPALTRAYRVQEKMAGVGFDWPSAAPALDKLDEEVEETRTAILSGDREHAEEEIGDLLFSVVNAARLAGFTAEEALRRSTEKVIARFQLLERLAVEEGHRLADLSLEEMDRYWEKAKRIEHGEERRRSGGESGNAAR